MKALRIHLKQNSANYKREETIDNKMTYPLPPYSTVIGALHKACGYKEYHAMDVSIQGSYGSIGKEVYYDNCFLNNLQNDRGILVKMVNEKMLSNGFIIVAEAKKAQGNDFRNGITIDVINEKCLNEYRAIKDMGDEIASYKKEKINPILEMIKKRKATLTALKKSDGISEERMQKIASREKELKEKEKIIKERLKAYETENYDIPISKFRTLTRGPKYYEVLYDVELIIHICADDEVLDDIYAHLNCLTSIGRSEDYIEIIDDDTGFTELRKIDSKYSCKNSAYIHSGMDKLKFTRKQGVPAKGTKYLLNKDYKIVNKKRVFNRKLVTYLSDFSILEGCPGVFVDDRDNIVSLA